MSRPSRRGSQSIEFGIVLPMLLVLTAGAVDVGQFLYVSERMVAVASEGARSGALADPDAGEDPVADATATAHQAWDASELDGDLTVVATLEGAAPTRRVVVRVTLGTSPFFGFVDLLPDTMEDVRTVRLTHQN